jgi:hypothetical protein
MTGRGLHHTPAAGIYADVWQWSATSGGPSGRIDDDHFGPPIKPTPMQLHNVIPYRGGFELDPRTANNFDAPFMRVAAFDHNQIRHTPACPAYSY